MVLLLLLLLLLLDELAWEGLGPAEPFFFFLLFDVGGRGAGFVFRPEQQVVFKASHLKRYLHLVLLLREEG